MRLHSTLIGLVMLLASIIASGQNVGINDDGTSPNASAMLDVKSTSRGLLPPRVALTSTSSASPISSPATALLVYNTATAGDVTPGYYFWNGTLWERFNAGASQLNVVAKSADATLLKTETFIIGSGNITLTLPTVTSADNGLAITIKNVGTYTDLTTVQGNGGATIDGLVSSSLLTRWQANTYVASGGNWVIKEKQTREDNVYQVSAKGSFTTIAEVIAFLGSHMTGPSTIRLGGGNYSVSSTQAINFTYPLTIEGTSYGETTITATTSSGNPTFNCTSECYFKMIDFDGSGAGDDGIRFIGTNQYYEVKDCNFTGFHRAVALNGSSEVWVFETDFNDATVAGIEVAGGSTLKVSECDYYNDAVGINLVSATNPVVSILNCTFYNTGTQTGILYVPATFSSFTSMFITNNAWNNVGTFVGGFDFTRSDGRDAKAFIQQNAGMEDKNPHVKINVIDNATSTTLTTANNWYKVNFTNTSSVPCKWTVANNKITYQPVNKRDVIMTIAGNVACTNNANRNITIGIMKNGTGSVYGPITVRTTTSAAYYPFTTVVYLEDITLNDYFEVYASSANSGDIIILSDLNWYTDSK